MAKRAEIAVLAVAMGVVMLCASGALFPAFVPPSGPGATSQPRFLSLSSTGGAPSEGPAASLGAATAAASLVAVLAIGRLVSARPVAAAARQSTTAVPIVARQLAGGYAADGGVDGIFPDEMVPQSEKPFAGGLIGGESAFSSGDYNFDPLGLSVKCERFLPWFREAELKHGRICMLAWVGLVVPDIARIPGPEPCYTASVIDAHKACTAFKGEQIANFGPAGPLFQVLLFCGIIEFFTTLAKVKQWEWKYYSREKMLKDAGNYKLGLQFLPKDELKANEMRLKELKNGRLAMIAFSGAITQAVLSGNSFPWLYAQGERQSSGLSSSVKPAQKPAPAPRAASSVTALGSYKMSKSVPFLPASPALEGYVGEEDGFDPMGFTLAIDIRWLREAELKHARVCMLATVGWIATDLGLRVPGEYFQVSTIDAHDAMVLFGSMPQMLIWIGYAEFYGFLAIIYMMEGKTDRKPGDFGLRTLYPKDEKGQYDMQMKELRNGRLAMLAFSGIVTSAVLTQKTWPFFAEGQGRRSEAAFGAGSALCGGLQSGNRHAGDSRVAAKALEASKSLPFLPKPQGLKGYVGEEAEFDPIGFTENVDIRWLREAELKHCRVCMLACVGFVAQQWIAFPGIPVTPNALDAPFTAPPALFAALIAAGGFIESSSYGRKMTMLDMFEDGRTPGDFNFGTGYLKGKSDDEIYDLKLKELTNGRLAMMAFSGMVHHNLVVSGPMFPIFPDDWAGPQYTWKLNGYFDSFARGEFGWNGSYGDAPPGFKY